MTPLLIIKEAIKLYKPKKALLLFSGGHDSLVSTHVSAQILERLGLEFVVYHGDTTIGIPETQDYVREVCASYGWELAIRRPPKPSDHYDELVKRYGFPGPNKQAHQIMYRRLKERALRAYVSHECKSSLFTRENFLLISGVRKAESKIRMGYSEYIQKERSRIWTCPIFYWTEQDCEKYMEKNDLPRNPVKDALCISGECLCGAFAGKEELSEIRTLYPGVGKRIDDLHQLAKEHGHPWPWTMGPTDWYKIHPPGQLDMFMCVGCESKRT